MTDRARRKVVGKAQLAVSAIGMCVVLVALWQGRILAAIIVFLLTIVTLEIMFQRALALFHPSPREPTIPGD
jgi:hypothetical protein